MNVAEQIQLEYQIKETLRGIKKYKSKWEECRDFLTNPNSDSNSFTYKRISDEFKSISELFNTYSEKYSRLKQAYDPFWEYSLEEFLKELEEC